LQLIDIVWGLQEQMLESAMIMLFESMFATPTATTPFRLPEIPSLRSFSQAGSHDLSPE
jgi:hypothetical protein